MKASNSLMTWLYQGFDLQHWPKHVPMPKKKYQDRQKIVKKSISSTFSWSYRELGDSAIQQVLWGGSQSTAWSPAAMTSLDCSTTSISSWNLTLNILPTNWTTGRRLWYASFVTKLAPSLENEGTSSITFSGFMTDKLNRNDSREGNSYAALYPSSNRFQRQGLFPSHRSTAKTSYALKEGHWTMAEHFAHSSEVCRGFKCTCDCSNFFICLHHLCYGNSCSPDYQVVCNGRGHRLNYQRKSIIISITLGRLWQVMPSISMWQPRQVSLRKVYRKLSIDGALDRASPMVIIL